MPTSERGSFGSDRECATQRQSAGVLTAVLALAFVAAAAVWSVDRPAFCLAAEGRSGEELKSTKIMAGDLSVDFLDNTNSPGILSGVDRLLNTKDAPEFDAFDPNDPGSSAGLNFEHIISGHNDPANWFAPRNGTYKLYRGPTANSVVLARKPDDDPWALESSMTYTVTAPHYIDFEFRCRTGDARRFGNRGYAVLFWADYMNDVEDVALHFRGVSGPGASEQWIAADAPATHPDHVGGGTYRSLPAPRLEYDSEHNLKLNMWSYEYPRFTRPFYYGRAGRGMTLMLMFDRMYRAEDEIRFSLFKFKVGPEVQRPAWDFQYVIHRMETGKEYGYRGRLVWKKFVSPEDCLQEYETWAKTAAVADSPPEASGNTIASAMANLLGLDAGKAAPGRWRLPPADPVTRDNPRLVNYFHMNMPDGWVKQKEERLAQWNVLILNHDMVADGKLSLARIRQINPKIKLLAWVPLQGPNGGLQSGVPPKGASDWYAKKADRSYLVPHWGGLLMNADASDRAWPKHVLAYVKRDCLKPGGYDGLMMDCLWQSEPGTCDVNGDGVHDARDSAAWQEAMLFLLRSLRQEYPETILVGNGGGPWSADCPYYEFANGCMHENALGDEFGDGQWQSMWEGYRRGVDAVQGRTPYHFLAVDVRADHRTAGQAALLDRLSQTDHRRMRVGLATTLLLDGGYFGFDRGDCLHGQLWWFDEYDVELGKPCASFQEDRYGKGTLSREFERGIVVVNPTDVAARVSGDTTLIDSTTRESGNEFLVPANDARILLLPSDE